jgi:hypothetical protein
VFDLWVVKIYESQAVTSCAYKRDSAALRYLQDCFIYACQLVLVNRAWQKKKKKKKKKKKNTFGGV